MKLKDKLILILILSICFGSCSNDIVSRTEAFEILSSSTEKLSVRVVHSPIEYTAKYHPTIWKVSNSFDDPTSEPDSTWNKVWIDNQAGIELQLDLKSETGPYLLSNIRSESEYAARISYLTNEVGNDVKLLVDQDTMKCLTHYFIRDYGLSGMSSLVLGFDSTSFPIQENIYLIFNDQISGELFRFDFDKNTINKLESLKIKNP